MRQPRCNLAAATPGMFLVAASAKSFWDGDVLKSNIYAIVGSPVSATGWFSPGFATEPDEELDLGSIEEADAVYLVAEKASPRTRSRGEEAQVRGNAIALKLRDL